MTAERYMDEKKRLSQAMCSSDRLATAVNDITETLRKYGLDTMPETALDVMIFTLKTIHLGKFNPEEYVL